MQRSYEDDVIDTIVELAMWDVPRTWGFLRCMGHVDGFFRVLTQLHVTAEELTPAVVRALWVIRNEVGDAERPKGNWGADLDSLHDRVLDRVLRRWTR